MKVVIQNSHGYTRGLYIDNELLLVGRSKGRVISHTHNKFIGNISDKGILSGSCEIKLVTKQTNNIISMDEIAEEIYDIVLAD